MEFSYQYRRVMGAFAENSYVDYFTNSPLDENEAFPVMATFKIVDGGGEIPTFLKGIVINDIPREGVFNVVYPMNVSSNHRIIAGAETILKEFCLNHQGSRLTRVATPKGEVYYGSRGVVFDRDFNPIIYTTATIKVSSGSTTLENYKFHISPKMFLEDTTLNKSILKKGIAYFLSNGINQGWRMPQAKVSILVDDGSEFFKKPNQPSVNTTNEEFANLLKDNIGDILNQLTYS